MLKNRFIQITLAAVALLLLVIIIGQRPARIAYHEWRLNTAKEAGSIIWYDEAIGEDVVGKPGWWDSYEKHRKALVKLGRLKFVEYRFKNVTFLSSQYERIMDDILADNCPGYDAQNLECPWNDAGGPLIIRVWCDSEDEADWLDFFADRDQVE